MTISTQQRTAGPYVGDGLTTDYPFAFVILEDQHMRAIVADANGVETVLLDGIDYTVTLNANQDLNPGGVVSLTTALATDQTMVMTSDEPYLQVMDLTNQGGFYPTVINDAMDRIVIMIQQLMTDVSRAVLVPLVQSETDNKDWWEVFQNALAELQKRTKVKVFHISADYTVDAFDTYSLAICDNDSAITVTLPQGIPEGVNVTFLKRGTGDVSFVAGGELVLPDPFAGQLRTANSSASVTCIDEAAGDWMLAGDLRDTLPY